MTAEGFAAVVVVVVVVEDAGDLEPQTVLHFLYAGFEASVVVQSTQGIAVIPHGTLASLDATMPAAFAPSPKFRQAGDETSTDLQAAHSET